MLNSRECLSGLLGYECVGIALSIQKHKCLTRALCIWAELESPTYIIQMGRWQAGGYQSLCGCSRGSVCVCVCLLGGALVAGLQEKAMMVYVH